MTSRRWALLAAVPAAFAGFTMATSGAGAATAGQPVPTQVLLCGMYTQGANTPSGQSDVIHPAGSTSMGQIYQYHGQTCEQEENQNDSIGTYNWTITHSTVHACETGSAPQCEFGAEHVLATLSTDGNQPAGGQGRITNFDLSMADNDGDPCQAGDGSNRNIFYASGALDSSNNCSPGGPGNFNTHGGAQNGDHFNGHYGTTVYQDNDMSNTGSQCNASLGSTNFCFEGVIIGFTN